VDVEFNLTTSDDYGEICKVSSRLGMYFERIESEKTNSFTEE